MPISFGSSPGNLFNVLGKCGLVLKQAKSYQSSQKTNLIDSVNGLTAQLSAEPDIQAIVGSSYINTLNAQDSSVGGLVQNVARQIINRKVFEDNPRLAQTLQQLQVLTSLQEVIRQMKNAGASVLAMTVSATPVVVNNPGPHFTGNGNGVINASTKRPFDGLTLENTYSENLTFTCIADSYLSSVQKGNESFAVTGTGSQSDLFAFNWPLGSNSRIGISAINALASNNQGNLLNNSGWDTWSGNLPTGWTLPVGTIGTSILQTGDAYSNGTALKLVGDGTTLVQWKQQFGNSAGTLGRLSPLTQYSICVFLKRDAVAAGSGNITVELVDSGGVQIKDANGVANAFNINLTTLTTQYAAFTGVFRTPEILPASQFLSFRLNTALTNNRTVFFDHCSQGVMSQCYVSGPFVACHSGSNGFTINDLATLTISNSRGAAGTLSTFQTLMTQLFTEMIGNELLLPSSATPTLSDTLIA